MWAVGARAKDAAWAAPADSVAELLCTQTPLRECHDRSTPRPEPPAQTGKVSRPPTDEDIQYLAASLTGTSQERLGALEQLVLVLIRVKSLLRLAWF